MSTCLCAHSFQPCPISWTSGSPCSAPNSPLLLLLLPARGDSDVTASRPMSSPDPDSDPAWLLSSLATAGSGGTCGTDLLLCADRREFADSMGVSGAGREPVLPRLWADSVTLPGWKQLDHILMKPSLQPAGAHTMYTHTHNMSRTAHLKSTHLCSAWPQARSCVQLCYAARDDDSMHSRLPLCGPARSSASDGGDTTTSIDAARSSASTDWMIIASEGTWHTHANNTTAW